MNFISKKFRHKEMPGYTVKHGNGGTVDAWYSRSDEHWIVQRLDAEGNQIGDAQFPYHSVDANRAIRHMLTDA